MPERIGEIGNVWLSKRPGSAQWCRTWYDGDTRQTRRASLGTDDLQAAKVRLWEWFAGHGDVQKQRPEDTALELVLVRYFQQQAKEQASAEMARIALAYWSDFFSGATVAEVTPARQREFIEWLYARRNPPFSDGYVKRILTVGKAALSRAHHEGELLAVPYVLPGQESPARKLVLTREQTQALWHAAELPHERMYLALAYGTLGRPQAILALRRSFADFGRRLLDQNPPGRQQTRKYRPTVPICDFLLPWLEEAPEGPLVQWRGRPIASFKTAWRALRARAELPVAAVPKTIRHTMATVLRSAGVPEAELQGMLGHKAYSGRTEDYAKYAPDYLGKAAAAVDAYMAGIET